MNGLGVMVRTSFATVLLLFAIAARATTDPALQFIENKNQWEQPVQFGARFPGGQLFFGPQKFAYYIVDADRMEELHELSHQVINESDGSSSRKAFVTAYWIYVEFLNANPDAKGVGFGKQKPYYNFFTGNERSRWASGAASFSGVWYESFYPGIDMKLYSAGHDLKYDFSVSPGADPCRIQWQYQGADAMTVINGNLFLKTSLGDIIERRPIAYQIINGEKIEVEAEYLLIDNTLSFVFPNGYDECSELVIDPLLIFSTYSGSTADNWGSTATPAEHGNLYSSGVTNHVNGGKFPATAGSFQTSYGGLYDVGLLKYDSTGSQLLYASYFGGSGSESPHSLIMNAQQELIVLGTTSSSNFPTTVTAFDTTYNGGVFTSNVIQYDHGSDIFVARISKDGKQLLASTYLGGSENDGLNTTNGPLRRNYGDELRGDVITDNDGNIYFSSVTASANFPLVNSLYSVFGGGTTDAVVMKLDKDLSHIIWGTYLGGSGTDAAHTLKFDSHGDIYTAGGTSSPDFPVDDRPVGQPSYQAAHNGNADGWIAKISNDGTTLLSATYTGTSSYDQVYFLEINSRDEIFVYGQTNAFGSDHKDFPILPASVFRNSNSGQFLQKFTSDLSTLLVSTVFGSGRGSPDISPTAFLVNDCDNIYMTGWGGLLNVFNGTWPSSSTVGMTVSNDAFQKTTSGSDFYFIVLTGDASRFLYGTFLGGTQSRTHVDGGTSRFDKGGIVYHAVCSGCSSYNVANRSTSDFPTTPNAWSHLNNSTNCNNAAFKFDLSSLKAGLQTNSVDYSRPGLTRVCLPDMIVFQNKSIGGEYFEWDLGDGTTLTRTDTTPVFHLYPGPGRYTVKLKAIDVNTCIGKDSVFKVVDVFLINTAVQDDDDICEGSSYQLNASGGVSYNWTTEDGPFSSGAAKPIITPTDTTAYFVTITDANGCVKSDTVQINVIPGIDVQFDALREGDCFERPAIHVINNTKTDPDITLTFDYGDNTTSQLEEDVHRYERDSVYQIRLTGVREFCVYEKVIPVPIFSIKVGNVITPLLPEGKNDTFFVQYGEIEGMAPYDYDLQTTVRIYNRWGTEIFHSSDYKNDWAGEGVAPGIYYYEVSIHGEQPCKGWVHLIK